MNDRFIVISLSFLLGECHELESVAVEIEAFFLAADIVDLHLSGVGVGDAYVARFPDAGWDCVWGGGKVVDFGFDIVRFDLGEMRHGGC